MKYLNKCKSQALYSLIATLIFWVQPATLQAVESTASLGTGEGQETSISNESLQELEAYIKNSKVQLERALKKIE